MGKAWIKTGAWSHGPIMPFGFPVEYVAPWLSSVAQKLTGRGRQMPSFQQFTGKTHRGRVEWKKTSFSNDKKKWNRGKREWKTESVREVMKKSGDCSQNPLWQSLVQPHPISKQAGMLLSNPARNSRESSVLVHLGLLLPSWKGPNFCLKSQPIAQGTPANWKNLGGEFSGRFGGTEGWQRGEESKLVEKIQNEYS